MLCEKCGTKNENDASFCEKCGSKLPKKSNLKHDKKIYACIILVLMVFGFIIANSIFGSPKEKIVKKLTHYYENYNQKENNKDDLIKVGNILKKEKEDEKTLKEIKNKVNDLYKTWITKFNIKYDDRDKLNNAYINLNGTLKSIYNYFNGLEYIMSKDTFNDFTSQVEKLKVSKDAYLNGKDNKDEYYKYYYFQKVIKEDCYYKEASKFVNNYVKDEINDLKNEISKIEEQSSNNDNEKLEKYISIIKYLNQNKTHNNIDLTSTEDYQTIYQNNSNELMNVLNNIIKEKEKDMNYDDIIKMIKDCKNLYLRNSDEYKKLDELLNKYEDKLPDSLLDMYLASSSNGTNSSKYGLKINDLEYDSYLSFSFKGNTQSQTYRLNKKYKTFKSTIVRGNDWDKDFKGEIVIYGDDKEIYRSGEITKENKIENEINIDITDVDDLKIEFITTNKVTGIGNLYIYLVEPNIYK